MPVFFITTDHIRDNTVVINTPLLHHLTKSLRVRPGEALIFVDDSKRRFHTTVTAISDRSLTATILSHELPPPTHTLPMHVGQAILKGDHMDWVIQKATELGVTSITPLITDRVIARPPTDRLSKQVDRWQRIAFEAAQQSERWEVPQVYPAQPLDDFCGHVEGPQLMLVERYSGVPLLLISAVPLEQPVVLLIGPEGGWSPDDLKCASEHGVAGVTLGPRILRAETAALAAISILGERLGYFGEGPNGQTNTSGRQE
jgi:16S rRNA (uracil1498-N3)-methyltransferase